MSASSTGAGAASEDLAVTAPDSDVSEIGSGAHHAHHDPSLPLEPEGFTSGPGGYLIEKLGDIHLSIDQAAKKTAGRALQALFPPAAKRDEKRKQEAIRIVKEAKLAAAPAGPADTPAAEQPATVASEAAILAPLPPCPPHLVEEIKAAVIAPLLQEAAEAAGSGAVRSVREAERAAQLAGVQAQRTHSGGSFERRE